MGSGQWVRTLLHIRGPCPSSFIPPALAVRVVDSLDYLPSLLSNRPRQGTVDFPHLTVNLPFSILHSGYSHSHSVSLPSLNQPLRPFLYGRHLFRYQTKKQILFLSRLVSSVVPYRDCRSLSYIESWWLHRVSKYARRLTTFRTLPFFLCLSSPSEINPTISDLGLPRHPPPSSDLNNAGSGWWPMPA